MIDEAGARVNLQQKQAKYEKPTVVTRRDTKFGSGISLQKREAESNGDMLVTEKDIALVLSSWTGIPVGKISEEEAFKLLDDNVITDSKTMLALAYLKNRKGAK